MSFICVCSVNFRHETRSDVRLKRRSVNVETNPKPQTAKNSQNFYVARSNFCCLHFRVAYVCVGVTVCVCLCFCLCLFVLFLFFVGGVFCSAFARNGAAINNYPRLSRTRALLWGYILSAGCAWLHLRTCFSVSAEQQQTTVCVEIC